MIRQTKMEHPLFINERINPYWREQLQDCVKFNLWNPDKPAIWLEGVGQVMQSYAAEYAEAQKGKP